MHFLIDENLPSHLSLWHGEHFAHVSELERSMQDTHIWDYAIMHDLIIVTKDSDFTERLLLADPPPKVVHIKVGNMKLKDFRTHLMAVWGDVETLLETCKIVSVYLDRIQGVK